MLYIELKRAFSNKKFIFSILTGLVILLFHFFVRTYGLIGIDLSEGVEFPLSSYQCWLGGDPMSMYASFFYLILPLLVALPHSGSDCFDIRTGYISNLITRGKKSTYYLSKTIATFLSGGTIAITPLIISFMLTSAFVPSLVPHVGVCRDAIGDNSFMGNLYYTKPFTYTVIYILINFIFFGLLSIFGLYISLYVDNILIATISPFLLYISTYVISNLLINISEVSWNPAMILQPAQASATQWYVLLIECFVMLCCGINYILISIRKERVV